jgi:uncharacterized protein (DUF1499 family)
MKKGYLLLLLGTIPVGLAILSALNPGNAAETSAAGEAAELSTRHYRIGLQTFVAEAEKIIPTLSTYGQNWRLTTSNLYENSAQIKAEVPVVVFTDDLEIRAKTKEGKRSVSVDVRSKSRVGSSDLGENRRHILQLLKAFDEKFNR